jgi:hypothetical protein
MTLVTGDPASMRAAAAMLRHNAETLSGIAGLVDSHVAGTTYVGPAADRFRGSMTTSSANLRAVCARMLSTADVLARQAAVVEEQLLLQARQEIY